MNAPYPQETGSTTLELESEGVANGLLSFVSSFYEVKYDEENGVYRLGDSK